MAGRANGVAGGDLVAHPGLAELAALLLGGAAPHTGLLVGGQGELEALAGDAALRADVLGRGDLVECETGGADGEEELRIGVPAGRSVPPGPEIPVVCADPGERHEASVSNSRSPHAALARPPVPRPSRPGLRAVTWLPGRLTPSHSGAQGS